MSDDNVDIDAGPCCICGGTADVFNVIMLQRRSTVPGTGWGCLVCDLPNDGAVAVICNGCLLDWQIDRSKLKFACLGYPASGARIPIEELPAAHFDHLTDHY